MATNSINDADQPGLSFPRTNSIDDADQPTIVAVPLTVQFSPLSAPAIVDFFLHNWAETVKIDAAFETDVSESADTLAEERVGLVDRPYRVVTFRWSGMDQDEVTRVIMALFDMENERYTIPLYCDQALLSAASSGTTVNCDPTNKRFFQGGKVLVCEYDPQTGNCLNAQVGVISVVGASTLTLVSALTGTFPASASVCFPLMDTEIILKTSVSLVTDSLCDFALTIAEVNGNSALPPTCQGSPPGVSTYQGWPIWSIETNWISDVKIGLNRAGQEYGRGRAKVVAPIGPRALLEFEFNLLMERVQAFEAIEFFDSRQGRLRPFWIAAPNALWGLFYGISTTYVDVEALGALADLTAHISSVAVVMLDGTVYVSNISSIVDNSMVNGTWRLNLSDAIPSLTLDEVKRVTSAHLVRFSKDVMEEEWVTDNICQVKIAMGEIINEYNVSIPNI